MKIEAGRIYRAAVVGGFTAVGGSGSLRAFVIGIAADRLSYVGSVASADVPAAAGGAFQTATIDVPGDDLLALGAVYARGLARSSVGTGSTFTVQLASLRFADVTESRTAADSVAAAVESANSAAAYRDEAGESASASHEDALSASTSAGNASFSEQQSAISANNSEDHANAAYQSQQLSAQAANDTQALLDQSSGVIADLQGRTEAWWQVKANAGTGSAIVGVRADGTTSYVTIAATKVVLANPDGEGGFMDALVIEGGDATFAGRLRANSVSATEIDVATLDAISATLGTVTSGLLRNASNTASFNLDTGRITTTAGGYRRVLGAGIGASGNLVDWFGPASVSVGKETIANSKWAIATDGKVYYGGTNEIDSGGSSASGGGSKLLANTVGTVSVSTSGSTESTAFSVSAPSVASGGKLRVTLGGNSFSTSGSGSLVVMNIKVKITYGSVTTQLWSGQISSNGTTYDLSALASAAAELDDNPGSGNGTLSVTVSRAGPTGLSMNGVLNVTLERLS